MLGTATRPLCLLSLSLSLSFLSFGAGCDKATSTESPESPASAETTAAAPAECNSRTGLMATVYNATAAEYRAATLQAFALARVALDAALADGMQSAAPEQQGDVRDLPPAVILDVDETVLDNSPYMAWLTLVGGHYEPKSWTAWVEARQARAIPGALEFTKYAASKGVAVFYVSNRDAAVEAATRANLEARGFPMGDGTLDVVLLKNEKPEWTSQKGSRRASVAATHRVLMLVGDNLGDFTDQSEGTIEERAAIIDHHGDFWGGRWVMIPNPMYGGWQSAALAGTAPKTQSEREEALLRPAATWSGPG